MKTFWSTLERKGSKKPHEHKAKSIDALIQRLKDDFRNHCQENPNDNYNCIESIIQLGTGKTYFIQLASVDTETYHVYLAYQYDQL